MTIKTDMDGMVSGSATEATMASSGRQEPGGRLNEVPVRQGLLSQAELAWSTPKAARSWSFGS